MSRRGLNFNELHFSWVDDLTCSDECPFKIMGWQSAWGVSGFGALFDCLYRPLYKVKTFATWDGKFHSVIPVPAIERRDYGNV